jgi:hypothetical protein
MKEKKLMLRIETQTSSGLTAIFKFPRHPKKTGAKQQLVRHGTLVGRNSSSILVIYIDFVSGFRNFISN